MNVLVVTINTLVFAAFVLFFVAACLWYTIRVALEFNRFNDGIKDWAQSLDRTMYDEINRASRRILRELDERISEDKDDNEETVDNNNEQENTIEND